MTLEKGSRLGPYEIVSALGQKFLFTRNEETQASGRIDVVVNWFEELKRRVPQN